MRNIGSKVLLPSLVILYLSDVINNDYIKPVTVDYPVKYLYLIDLPSDGIIRPYDRIVILRCSEDNWI